MLNIINSAYKQSFFKELREKIEEQIINIQIESNHLENLGANINKIVISLCDKYKSKLEIEENNEKYWQMPPNPKILIIGEEHHLKKNDIVGIAKSLNIDKDKIDLILDYNRIVNINFASLECSGVYSDIIFGANPHSTKDKGDFSSITEKIKQNQQNYPKLHLLRTNNSANELKLTKTSLKEALLNTRLYKDNIDSNS